ncbi:MAG TPA: BT_3928 family protein [Bacteroidales bacterium]|nr:BT_3928 family protein [Bacteroidales bacterium]
MRILSIIARIITGSAFLFSGFVKAVDPLGTAYKFQDYFSAFNVGFLSELSLFFAVLLCTIEFIAGFSLLTGLRLEAATRVIILLLLIFTPLTFILALTNPVTDCGCFGDAIKLTNWQTFWKNIILVLFTSILFINRDKIKKSNPITGLGLITLVTLMFVMFASYNLRFLPVIDFLPYKTGVHIADKMTIPAGASPDRYETTFLYEKDGVVKEFHLSDYPADDTTWKFIDQKSVLKEKGYVPPIHDFVVTDETGTDITQIILTDPRYSFLLISKKLDEANEQEIAEGLDYGRYLMNLGMKFYVFTASGKNSTVAYRDEFQFCSVDETTLKTMVRANPGFMLIHDGTIIGKWSLSGIPEKEWFSDIMKNDINFNTN